MSAADTGPTGVDAFPVATTRTRDVFGWDSTHTVEDTIRKQLRRDP